MTTRNQAQIIDRGTADVIASCDDVAHEELAFGPNLLVNGSMGQGQGLGATSIAGPGWTTSYTVPSGGDLFGGAGAGAATWAFYDATNRAQLFGGAGAVGLNPIGSGKAFGTNIGPNLTIPIIQWANILLEAGHNYAFEADAACVRNGAPFTPDVSVRLLADGVTPLAALPTASIPVNMWGHTGVAFEWTGATGYHSVGLYSNSAVAGGNDAAFDNFTLREVTAANLGAVTPRVYDQTVRSIIDHVLQTVGCNDDRRDHLLSSLLDTQLATPQTLNSALSRINAVAAGSTVAGLMSATFVNVGTTAGQVLGVALNPGEAVSFDGYFDEVTRNMVRLPAIAYVASATAILHISTQG